MRFLDTPICNDTQQRHLFAIRVHIHQTRVLNLGKDVRPSGMHVRFVVCLTCRTKVIVVTIEADIPNGLDGPSAPITCNAGMSRITTARTGHHLARGHVRDPAWMALDHDVAAFAQGRYGDRGGTGHGNTCEWVMFFLLHSPRKQRGLDDQQ